MLPIRILDLALLVLIGFFTLLGFRIIVFNVRVLIEVMPFILLLIPLLAVVRWGIIVFRGMQNPYFAVLGARVFSFIAMGSLVLIAIRTHTGGRPEDWHFLIPVFSFILTILISFLYSEKRRVYDAKEPDEEIGANDKKFSLIIHAILGLTFAIYVYKYFYASEEFRSWYNVLSPQRSFLVRNISWIFLFWVVVKMGVEQAFKLKDVLVTRKVSRFFYGISLMGIGGTLFIMEMSRGREYEMLLLGMAGYGFSILMYALFPTRERGSEDVLDGLEFEDEESI
ncbi:MAG: hypothetical protein HUJ25_16295 [Crocinitomicaceae bacterium]|nr:hypothetical protein [Crocinitomicaceae bacterium]